MGAALALLLGVLNGTAMAKDTDLGKLTESQVKAGCEAAGAKFLTDGQTYGCKKQCPGWTCAVICDKDDGCIGVTPAKRAQGATGERGVFDTLNAATDTIQEGDNKSFLWGLVGLVGLAGLLGLNKRSNRPGV